MSIIKSQPVHQFDLTQYKNSYDDWIKAFERSLIKRTTNGHHKIFIGLSSGYDSGAISCGLNRLGIKYHAYSIVGAEDENMINLRSTLIKNSNNQITIKKLDRDTFNKFVII